MKIITPQLRTRLHLLPWSGSPTTAPIYMEGTSAPQVVAHIRQSGALREVTEGKPPHTVLEVQDIDADGLRIDRKYMELAELDPQRIHDDILLLLSNSKRIEDLFELALRIVEDVTEVEARSTKSCRSNEVMFLFYFMASRHCGHSVSSVARYAGKHHTTVMHALRVIVRLINTKHPLWIEYIERARHLLHTGVLLPSSWTSTPVEGPVEVIFRAGGRVEASFGMIKNSGYSLEGILTPKARLKWRPKN